MKSLLSTAALCCLIFSHSADVLAVEISQITPGAWAALQPEARRLNDCNSLIVEAKDFVVVVDAQENADDVRQIMQFVENEIGKPVGYLINTHWHSDHTQGNTLYREKYGDSLVIIGHRTQAEDIPNRAAVYVRDRVEKASQAAHLTARAGHIAIKPIGKCCGGKETEHNPVR